MTKFNQAALSAAASLALFGGALTLITPAPANAGMNCSSDSYGNTSCYGGGGGSFNSSSDGYGNTNYYGTDSNGNSFGGSCSSDGYGNTSCY
ncbi:hypothetical protein OAL32_03335 [Synechococcus sp. AH-551-G15]|nr:hypothetical protein [Synechococcus sp. AH-551-G15]